MPHDLSTGRIYRETTGGETYGIIDPGDVCPILGITGEGSVGALCTHANINRDALFKPYKHTDPLNPNFATGGPDGKYGWTIPDTQNDIKTPAFWNTLWAFNPPDEWYNLQEFDGYNHNVRFDSHPWGLKVIETSSQIMCSFNWDGPSSYGDEFVCPKSMALFQDYYMAVAILVGSGTTWAFRYAKSHNQKISQAIGCLLTIDQSDYDHTLPTVGNYLMLIPFLASVNFAQNGTANENSLSGVRKLGINYKDKQYAYVGGTAPSSRTFEFTLLEIIKVSSYVVQVRVRATNLTGSTATGAFYLLYAFYKETTQGGYVYKDLLLDCTTYVSGRNPEVNNMSVAAYSSQEYTLTLGGIDGGAHGFDADDITVTDVKVHSPSNPNSDTSYKEMRF